MHISDLFTAGAIAWRRVLLRARNSKPFSTSRAR
jgi:hypothetical protein